MLPSVNHFCVCLEPDKGSGESKRLYPFHECPFFFFIKVITSWTLPHPTGRTTVTSLKGTWEFLQESCLTWIFFALCAATPWRRTVMQYSSSDPSSFALSGSSDCASHHRETLREKLYIHDTRPRLHFFLCPPEYAVSLSSHQHADCWHQHSAAHLKGCIEHALNTQLWGWGVWRVEEIDTLWMILIFDASFIDFSLLGDGAQ